MNQPLSVIVVNRFTAITFDSSVHGATVYLDGSLVGSDEDQSKTPLTDNLVTPGNPSATFRLSGYKDAVAFFYVEAGKPQTIYVTLQPMLKSPVRLVKPMVTVLQVQPANVQAIAAIVNAQLTAVPTPSPTLLPCPSGYVCESLAAAQSAYGADGYTQYGTLPCNYTGRALSKEQVREYCIKPLGKPVERIALKTGVIKPVGVGQFGVQCPAGSTLCPDNSCYDLTSDPNHCGSCTGTCSSDQTCTGG